MEEIEIPTYFLCPISLELMKDPVTLSTGITYNRESIEKWMLSGKNKTCPVTKQVLTEFEVTPNHTLRRLIQAWCVANASYGIDRIPTPKPPVDKNLIIKILEEARILRLQLKSLQKLKEIASQSERNRRCVVSAGAAEILASIIKSCNEEEVLNEALSIFYHLDIPSELLRHVNRNNYDFFESLIRILRRENNQLRAYAILIIKSSVQVLESGYLIGLGKEVFKEIMQVVQDKISDQISKSALKIILELCPWGRNRLKVVDVGTVHILIEILLETSDKRTCEIVLSLLYELCKYAEGRAEFSRHSAGIAIISKKILRISTTASDRAVKILCSISGPSASPRILEEMLQVGAVNKLFLVLQLDCGSKIKEKIREILNLHGRIWKNSLCISQPLMSDYFAFVTREEH